MPNRLQWRNNGMGKSFRSVNLHRRFHFSFFHSKCQYGWKSASVCVCVSPNSVWNFCSAYVYRIRIDKVEALKKPFNGKNESKNTNARKLFSIFINYRQSLVGFKRAHTHTPIRGNTMMMMMTSPATTTTTIEKAGKIKNLYKVVYLT